MPRRGPRARPLQFLAAVGPEVEVRIFVHAVLFGGEEPRGRVVEFRVEVCGYWGPEGSRFRVGFKAF